VLKSVALLNQKISESGNIESATLELLSGLVPTLIGIAGSNMASATREAAFLCIAALVRKVGKRDVDVYIKALPVSTACIEDSDRDLASSAIACLSCLVHVFGARCITHLPKFMPSVLRIISNFLAGDEASSGKSTLNFVYAALSCVSVIVNSIPKFISPYIPTILSFSLAPFFLSKKNHGSRLHQQISESNLALCVALTDKVPCRIILPAIFNHLKPAMKVGGVDSTIMLYRMLSKSVEKMSGTELLENYSGIFRFYLYGFDFKGERVEEELTESFLNFVGKLNDTMFRSLFLKMVEWGTATVEEGEEERVGLFYRILTALLDKLKSMFAPYCGYVLDGALGHLMQFAEGGEKAVDIKVWGDILVFMKKFFSYENEGMINAEKFARVYPVLLSQIDTDVIEGDEFVEIVKKYLVPVLGQLAVNVSSDDLWKKLNFAVLMKTRDDDPRIRLACLWVELELWKVLGEDFLVFLEESIPFLAELREDVDEDVDALCGKVLVGIEGLLGSSLDTYFEK
jgi:U3 small nucleolar RNA-associated protein 10